MADRPRHAFVCGHPVGHSRSPLIHGHWLAGHGIAGSYRAIDVPPEDFADFLATLARRGLAGGNVTIPHKEAAHALVSRRDPAAEAIGAVNTVWLDDGRLAGANTDAFGFAANLDAHAPGWRRGGNALVLGAGGAARAVVFALLEAGFDEVRLANRTAGRARALADRFGSRIVPVEWAGLDEAAPDAALVVNTTALGMGNDALPPLDVAKLPDAALVTDIVYVPLRTPLLAAAEERGLSTVDGLGMLLHQAVPGFERWFGVRPEVTPELRSLVLADLGVHA